MNAIMHRKRDPNDRRRVNLEIVMDAVRREVFPVFGQLAQHMSALAEGKA